MISVKNVSKSYGKTQVYKNFNFEIEDGKITCVLGESGSGKTTLLNMIAAITPYEGEITPVKCSYVFQDPRLVPNLTVSGNLRLVCKDGSAVENMLAAVGLSDKAESYPAELSGGQKRRVSLARAFLYGADLVLLDEPFSSLDLKIKLEMIELFSKLQKEGKKTALFVTHDVDEAVMLSDRVVILKGGKITFDIMADGKNGDINAFGKESEIKNKLIAEILK